MNCEDYLLMLDEYVEHELDGKSAAQISAHIAGCAPCAAQYETLRREHSIYSQYRLDIEATPSLWANVQTDIEKIQRERLPTGDFRGRLAKIFSGSAFNPAFAAASFVLLITLGVIVGVIKYKSTDVSFSEEIVSRKNDVESSPEKTDEDAKNETSISDGKDNAGKSKDKIAVVKAENHIKRKVSRFNLSKSANQVAKSKPVNLNREPTTDEVIEKAERQYKSAIAILTGDIKRRRAQMSPNFVSLYELPLVEIDRTIDATRRAVRAQPNDAVAIQYMTAAYAKKIELLRTMTED